MIADYEDDTHFCLKCDTTIIGLDNYVNHRKTGCSKPVVELPKSPLPSQLLPPDESFNLKADDFFSSLELQSSSKKLPQSTSGKNFSGILTRSKTTAAIHAKDNPQDISQSKSGKNVWIGGHQLKLGSGDNQSKLFNALDQLERRKDEPAKDDDVTWTDEESDDYEYDDEESSEEENQDGPPRHHTGGKWKPSSPIQWSRPDYCSVLPSPTYTGGKWKPAVKRSTSPPPSHTKGKWKPSSPREGYDYPPPTFTGSKWSQSKIPPTTHTKGKWKPDENWSQTKDPPPTHTKGKWKPSSEDNLKKSKPKTKDDDLEEMSPDPTYTKGKWIPPENLKKTKITDDSPFRKSSGMVQYWCRPCNRRLASKIIYERHLKTELHFKRTIHDKEFDEAAVGVPEKRSKTKIVIIEPKVESREIKKRKRKKIFLKCEVCKAKVSNCLIGKHLISHYHCRKGDIKTPIAKSLVLENIWAIILQSPFQCGVCHFYCNHNKEFLQHWLSDYHLSKEKTRKGYFWCSFCKFKDDNSGVMYSHLTSKEHSEVISVINRSVPIVIKKVNPAICKDCNEEFLLNIALIRHCRIEKHNGSHLEPYKNNFICATCNCVFRSSISLRRHQQNTHGIYACLPCNVNFKTSQEAKFHRNSTEHKYNMIKPDPIKTELKDCDYCNQKFLNFLDFKKHLKEQHPNFCPKCIHCGTMFAVPQELSVHLRTKSCDYSQNLSSANCCDKCPFSSDSMAEFLFHQVLHGEALILYSESKNQPTPMYKCPLCEKWFPKSSLQGHLRIHTKERPFACTICKKDFARKNNWVYHMKNHEKKNDKGKINSQVSQEKMEMGSRPFLCSTCGASFHKKSILHQHMTTHTGKLCKCPKADCVFAARSMGELKSHFVVHSTKKSFACTLCDYRGKSKQQLKRHSTIHEQQKKFKCNKCKFTARFATHLKRHSRLHTGSKPYNCPHCSYKCNNMENLRKHILNTEKHRGKAIYECHFCLTNKYQTNFAKEFKVHLVNQHPTMFNSSKATTYIAGIYDAQEDSNLPDVVLDQEDDSEVKVLTTENKDSDKPTVIIVQKNEEHNAIVVDPVVGPSTANLEEMFPMYIVSADTEGWNLIGNYGVEESGALVPFNNENDTLFQEI